MDKQNQNWDQAIVLLILGGSVLIVLLMILVKILNR